MAVSKLPTSNEQEAIKSMKNRQKKIAWESLGIIYHYGYSVLWIFKRGLEEENVDGPN